MRILLIEPDLQDNGALRVSLDRAVRWQAMGAEVILLVMRHGDHGACIPPPEGLRVRYATERPRRLRLLLPAALWRAWRLALRSDVVVAGREVDLGILLAALTSVLSRRPLAVTVQSRADAAIAEHTPSQLRRANRAALARADAAVCVSAGLVSGLTQMGAPTARVHVVENGIDVGKVREAASAEPEALLPAGSIVVASGRLTRQKGFDLLITAHARVLERGGPQHSLVILGEGPAREALLAQARKLGCSSTVVLAGHTANPHAVVARADLFVLSSRWEGYALVVAEAVSIGVPVISTDCVSGPAEVLDGGAFGVLVAPGDVDALASAILEHLVDPASLHAKAHAGSESAVRRFDADRAARRHLDVLTQVVASR